MDSEGGRPLTSARGGEYHFYMPPSLSSYTFNPKKHAASLSLGSTAAPNNDGGDPIHWSRAGNQGRRCPCNPARTLDKHRHTSMQTQSRTHTHAHTKWACVDCRNLFTMHPKLRQIVCADNKKCFHVLLLDHKKKHRQLALTQKQPKPFRVC